MPEDKLVFLGVPGAPGGGGGTPANDSVTNAKLANMATQTIKGRATAGTGDPEDLTATEVRTLINVANGATANATDAQLRDRSTHTGTQTSASIADFTEAVQDAVAAVLAQGTNVTLTYDDVANTLTVAAAGGGGGLDAEAVRDAIGVALVGVGNISIVVNDALDTITISTTATVNATDAALRDRSTHTGTQATSTVTGLDAALAGKEAALGNPASNGQILSSTTAGTRSWKNDPSALETKIYVDDQTGPADYQKIQQAIDAAFTAGGGIVKFSGRTYDISAAPFQTTGGANAQILFPNYNPFNDILPSVVLEGTIVPAFSYSVISSDNTSVPSWSGTVIVSDRVGTGTLPCMFGGIGDSTVGGGFEYFTKIQVTFDKITFRSGNNHSTGNPAVPAIATVSAVDGRYFWICRVTNCLADTGLNNALYVDADPPATGTVGFCVSGPANAGMNLFDNIMSIGFYEGFRCAEHTQIGTIWPSYCVRGLAFFGGTDPTHGLYCQRLSSVWNGTDIYADNGIIVVIDQLDIEGYDDAYFGAQYFSKDYTVDDPNNNLRGEIKYIAGQQIPLYSLMAFKVSGCSKVKIDRIKPLRANMATTSILAGSTTHTNYGNTDYYNTQLWAQVPGALNDEIALDFSEAGNDALWLQKPALYRFHLIWTSETVAGIVQFSYGTGGYKDSIAGPVDMYAATSVKNNHSIWEMPIYTEDNINALHFKLKITGKNASSGGYSRYFSGAWIERVG